MILCHTYQNQGVSIAMVLYYIKMSLQTVYLFPRVDERELVQLVCIVTNSSDQSAIDVCRDSLAGTQGVRKVQLCDIFPYQSSQEFLQRYS